MTELERIAAGLTKAQREALSKHWSRSFGTCSETGATGMASTLLACRQLLDRRWATWGQDRVNGQKRGEGYEYRLTPLGLAVRAYLAATTGEG